MGLYLAVKLKRPWPMKGPGALLTSQDSTLSFIPIAQEGADVCHYPPRTKSDGAGICRPL